MWQLYMLPSALIIHGSNATLELYTQQCIVHYYSTIQQNYRTTKTHCANTHTLTTQQHRTNIAPMGRAYILRFEGHTQEEYTTIHNKTSTQSTCVEALISSSERCSLLCFSVMAKRIPRSTQFPQRGSPDDPSHGRAPTDETPLHGLRHRRLHLKSMQHTRILANRLTAASSYLVWKVPV